jgi:hypothetical protein
LGYKIMSSIKDILASKSSTKEASTLEQLQEIQEQEVPQTAETIEGADTFSTEESSPEDPTGPDADSTLVEETYVGGGTEITIQKKEVAGYDSYKVIRLTSIVRANGTKLLPIKGFITPDSPETLEIAELFVTRGLLSK